MSTLKIRPSNIVSLRDFSQKSEIRRKVTEGGEILFIKNSVRSQKNRKTSGFYIIPDTLFENWNYDNDEDITKALASLVESPRMKEMESMVEDLALSGIIVDPNLS